MGLFTTQTMTIKKNVTKTVSRQPTSGYEDIVDANGNILVVPCRITRNNLGSRMFLFILASYYNTIPGGLHRHYQVNFTGMIQNYVVSNEPFWAGGLSHHIEADLEEMA